MRHAVQTKFHRRKTSSCLAVNTTVMSGNILSASGEKTSDADRQMGCRWCERQELQPTRGATPSLCKTTSENTGTKHNQKKQKIGKNTTIIAIFMLTGYPQVSCVASHFLCVSLYSLLVLPGPLVLVCPLCSHFVPHGMQCVLSFFPWTFAFCFLHCGFLDIGYQLVRLPLCLRLDAFFIDELQQLFWEQ